MVVESLSDPPSDRGKGPRENPWAYALLLIPTVALLVPTFYFRTEPALGPFPFFYWYQLAWVVATGVLTAAAYPLLYRRRDGKRDKRERP